MSSDKHCMYIYIFFFCIVLFFFTVFPVLDLYGFNFIKKDIFDILTESINDYGFYIYAFLLAKAQFSFILPSGAKVHSSRSNHATGFHRIHICPVLLGMSILPCLRLYGLLLLVTCLLFSIRSTVDFGKCSIGSICIAILSVYAI